MSSPLYHPKKRFDDSPKGNNDKLPNLFHISQTSTYFPNCHLSFIKKNNQLKKVVYSSFDKSPPSLSPPNDTNNNQSNFLKSKKTKDTNEQLESSNYNKIKDIYENKKKFQRSMWFQNNFKWDTNSNMTYKNQKPFETNNFNLENFPFQKKKKSVSQIPQIKKENEPEYPSFITKNTVESEKNIQKKIIVLKERIKQQSIHFRRHDPRIKIKKQRVVLRDIGQSAKEAHYFVYEHEDKVEAELIRRSRARSSGYEKLNKDEYMEFKKRHQKNITFYNEKDNVYNKFNITPLVKK